MPLSSAHPRAHGRGLHSGRPARVELRPGRRPGIWFYRQGPDGPVGLEATAAHTAEVDYRLRLDHPLGAIDTIEHLLAAAAMTRHYQLEVHIEGPEVPILDGSAAPWCALLAGLPSRPPPEPIAPERSIEVREGPRWVRLEPAGMFSLDFSWGGPRMPTRTLRHRGWPWELSDELAPARTFGFLPDAPALHAAGLALGADHDCCLVFDENGIPVETQRYEDEPMRHKALDIIGDLTLLGGPLRARYRAHQPGHRLHRRLLLQLALALFCVLPGPARAELRFHAPEGAQPPLVALRRGAERSVWTLELDPSGRDWWVLLPQQVKRADLSLVPASGLHRLARLAAPRLIEEFQTDPCAPAEDTAEVDSIRAALGRQWAAEEQAEGGPPAPAARLRPWPTDAALGITPDPPTAVAAAHAEHGGQLLHLPAVPPDSALRVVVHEAVPRLPQAIGEARGLRLLALAPTPLGPALEPLLEQPRSVDARPSEEGFADLVEEARTGPALEYRWLADSCAPCTTLPLDPSLAADLGEDQFDRSRARPLWLVAARVAGDEALIEQPSEPLQSLWRVRHSWPEAIPCSDPREDWARAPGEDAPLPPVVAD